MGAGLAGLEEIQGPGSGEECAPGLMPKPRSFRLLVLMQAHSTAADLPGRMRVL